MQCTPDVVVTGFLLGLGLSLGSCLVLACSTYFYFFIKERFAIKRARLGI